MPELEIQVRPLEGNWREVRMVYEVHPETPTAKPVHICGKEASTEIVIFVLAFAEGIANSAKAWPLAAAIAHFSEWMHRTLGCDCQKTRH